MQKPAQTPAPPHALEQGYRAEAADHGHFSGVLNAAIDYRGDVTLTLQSAEEVTGFLYDRKESPDSVRILPKDGSGRKTIQVSDLAAIEFSGKDTASGKSFDTWMKKYVEKKLSGQRAAIESEALD